ncbi:hypothetical protein AB1K54_00910 [Microbacterium sp. BWT-B31]|uniref:hypothetical protein n=1 Tax=Microbacterium sp. BWT-B31 TaxID=3232072 RepID=UPI0035272872
MRHPRPEPAEDRRRTAGPRAARRPGLRTAGAAASALLALGLLAACASETPAAPSAGPNPAPTALPHESITAAPDPSPSATAAVRATIPDDCRAMVDAAVLAQLEGIPLNDPAFGPSGVQPDGSLVCVWADPGADTTGLVTKIEYRSRGPALDMLNQLVTAEGFTCYTPDGGTRCEKTWPNATYPVTDGRTLFWRDDVLIDTRFSNLAPSGYTSAIVASIWG